MVRCGWREGALAALLVSLAWTAEAVPQRSAPTPAPAPPGTTPFVPRFEAVAETRLLMEGLALANYRGLERLLKDKPADAEAWTFARGQALLVAETGNLLMLRPPRNEGRDAWMRRAMDLRQSAANLARNLGRQDYAASRQALTDLTATCNRCHQGFRVPVRVGPPAEEGPGRKVEAPPGR